jgi:DNA-binding beta-propeller fold protein YncE
MLRSRFLVRLRKVGFRKSVWVALASVSVLTVAQPSFADPGDQIWSAQFNGPQTVSDKPNSIVRSPDGSRIYVTGSSGRQRDPGGIVSGTAVDYATVAYNAATGQQLWTAGYDGPDHREDVAHSVATSPDGTRVYVSGYSEKNGGPYDFATIAYNASTGAQLWVARYLGPDLPGFSGTVASLVVSPDGARLYVSGASYAQGQIDFGTIAYDAATGAKIWAARYDGGGSDDTAFSLALSPDGTRVFVTGQGEDSLTTLLRFATVAYDAASGAQLWVAGLDGFLGADAIARSVAVSPDGTRVFVTGKIDSLPGNIGAADYATAAYNAQTGAQLWAARYAGSAKGGRGATRVAVSPTGNRVYVTGTSSGLGTDLDYATIAYDGTTGAQLWEARYNGPASLVDEASSLAVSPDGARIYVTGSSEGSQGPLLGRRDYGTIAYEATTGAELWVARYHGTGEANDYGRALVVSPSGSQVYVTGQSHGGATDWDYATIAYEADSGA